MNNPVKKEHFKFLKELSSNNDREWFNANKPRYQEAHASFKELVASVEEELNTFDQIEKAKVMRIYRDVRFSKNKAPYKEFLAASYTRDGKYRRGGFYFKVQPFKIYS